MRFDIRDEVLIKCEDTDGEELLCVPDGVKRIGRRAVAYNEHILEVVLPDSVEVISEGAFAHCEKLQRVRLGSGVHTIREKAFRMCRELTDISFPESLEYVHYSALTGTKWLKERSGIVMLNGSYLFRYTGNAEHIVIPKGVRVIGGQAFADNKTIRSVSYPSSLKKVLASAFKGCSGITEAVLPEGIEYVGTYAYSGAALEKIVIPSTMKKVERYAFSEWYQPEYNRYWHRPEKTVTESAVAHIEIYLQGPDIFSVMDYCALPQDIHRSGLTRGRKLFLFVPYVYPTKLGYFRAVDAADGFLFKYNSGAVIEEEGHRLFKKYISTQYLRRPEMEWQFSDGLSQVLLRYMCREQMFNSLSEALELTRGNTELTAIVVEERRFFRNDEFDLE